MQVAITNHQKLFGVKFDEDVKGERLVAKLRNKLTIVGECVFCVFFTGLDYVFTIVH